MIPPDIELVLSQDDWLRRIARQLVSDPELADDLVQDAWVAGLERGRTGADSRPWLKGVLRNSGKAFFRASSRRRSREERVASAGAAPSTDEVVEQLQLRERASREMLALEEPYRTALYLRFVAGVSMRETARRMDVAPSTASDRVQEGLARLRKRIDRSYDGDRRAWVTAILPLARPAGVAALTHGGLIMLAAGTLLLGAIAIGSALRGASPPDPGASSPSLAPLLAAVDPEMSPEPTVLATVPSSTAGREAFEPTPPIVVKGAEPTVQQAPEAGVSGQFLLPSGAPAAGATWTIHGFGGNHERVLEHGRPANWTDPTGVLDATGRIEARFEAPQAYQFSVALSLEGFVTERWRWGQIKPTEIKDIGTITLRVAGTVTGRVVNSAGVPLVQHRWRVYADEVADRTGLGRGIAREITSSDEETAAFTLSGLPAGAVTLKVYDKQIGWSKKLTVLVTAGQTVTKDIVLDEVEAFANTITVIISKRLYHSAPDPSQEHIWLVTAGGSRRSAHAVPGATSKYAFDDVGPAELRIEIDDPRYLPWSQVDVTKGSALRARLRGSAAVVLDVHTANGAPIHQFMVDVTFENVMFSPKHFRPVDGTSPLTDGLLDGLVPADYTITVRTPGGTGSARVDGLAAGETRPVAITLFESTFARGIVLHPDGSPAAGAQVRLVIPAQVDDSPMSMVFGPGNVASRHDICRHERQRATTDEDGTFALRVEAPGTYLVLAGDRTRTQSESARFDTSATTAPDDLALTLARGGVVEGRVLFPAGLNPKGREIVLMRSNPSTPGKPFYRRAPLDGEGQFRLGPMVAGPGDLFLTTGGSWSMHNGAPSSSFALGGIQLIDGETTTANFDYPGGALAQITLDLAPCGIGPTTVTATIVNGQRHSVITLAGTAPTLGPITLEAGAYDVWVCGPGWLARHTGLTVVAGETRTTAIDLGLATRRVKFMAGGSPLASTGIQVADSPTSMVGSVFQTDVNGWVDLRLGAGQYSFYIQSRDLEMIMLQASATWPLPGGEDVITFE